MSTTPAQNLDLKTLVERALERGVAQVESAGSPMHPLLLDQSGRLMILFDATGQQDPMELASKTIKQHAPDAVRCALVIDTVITFKDGKKWDAIIVMACEKGGDEGELWAQRYVPKKLLRKFRIEGSAERLGKSKDFITQALDAS